jgi:site-specific DNA-methyltransferase (adenine-specific)
LHFAKGKNPTWHPVEYLKKGVFPYMLNGKPRGWFTDQETGEKCRWTGIGNILYYSQPTTNSRFEKLQHSAQKPIMLWSELLMLTSNVGDTILDPFGGSFSSGIASILCERNYIGIEQDETTFNNGKQWIETAKWEERSNYLKQHIKNDEKKFVFGRVN